MNKVDSGIIHCTVGSYFQRLFKMYARSSKSSRAAYLSLNKARNTLLSKRRGYIKQLSHSQGWMGKE